MKFPKDAPSGRVLKALSNLGFNVVRPGNHISLERVNPDETKTPMTIPGHRLIKGSTLRTICRQANIPREDFLKAYREA